MIRFYSSCRKKCDPLLFPLGFKGYKQHYYRVINKVIQRVDFVKIGAYRYKICFDFSPLCGKKVYREDEGYFDGNMIITPQYFNEQGIQKFYEEPTEPDYWIEKFYHILDENIIPWFELGSNSDNALCIMKYLRENCPLNRKEYGRKSFLPIEKVYFFYAQENKYEKFEELFDEYIENYLMKTYPQYNLKDLAPYQFIEEYRGKTQEEVEQILKINEAINLKELKWNI